MCNLFLSLQEMLKFASFFVQSNPRNVRVQRDINLQYCANLKRTVKRIGLYMSYMKGLSPVTFDGQPYLVREITAQSSNALMEENFCSSDLDTVVL